MTAPGWMDYLTAAKTLMEILKSAREELPRGPRADLAEKQIEKAESALHTTEAELAKSLGYQLCRCRFPPTIMLWSGAERTNICPVCADRNPPPVEVHRVPEYDPWLDARR